MTKEDTEMEIGEPDRTYEVEPLYDPVPSERPVPVPAEPAEAPAPADAVEAHA